MKKLMVKIGLFAGIVVADMGFMAIIVKLLGLIWQRFPLTDDYVENHPKRALARLGARIAITLITVSLICVTPAFYVIDIISTWCDKHFGEDHIEVKDEWD